MFSDQEVQLKIAELLEKEAIEKEALWGLKAGESLARNVFKGGAKGSARANRAANFARFKNKGATAAAAPAAAPAAAAAPAWGQAGTPAAASHPWASAPPGQAAAARPARTTGVQQELPFPAAQGEQMSLFGPKSRPAPSPTAQPQVSAAAGPSRTLRMPAGQLGSRPGTSATAPRGVDRSAIMNAPNPDAMAAQMNAEARSMATPQVSGVLGPATPSNLNKAVQKQIPGQETVGMLGGQVGYRAAAGGRQRLQSRGATSEIIAPAQRRASRSPERMQGAAAARGRVQDLIASKMKDGEFQGMYTSRARLRHPAALGGPRL